jgi:hypothetical protein
MSRHAPFMIVREMHPALRQAQQNRGLFDRFSPSYLWNQQEMRIFPTPICYILFQNSTVPSIWQGFSSLIDAVMLPDSRIEDAPFVKPLFVLYFISTAGCPAL